MASTRRATHWTWRCARGGGGARRRSWWSGCWRRWGCRPGVLRARQHGFAVELAVPGDATRRWTRIRPHGRPAATGAALDSSSWPEHQQRVIVDLAGAGMLTRQRIARAAPRPGRLRARCPKGLRTARWHRGPVARLKRADCSGPGIRRRRRGKGFEYIDEDGRRVSEPSVIERIRELAIPPAWEEVWICPYPMGHIQATGTDAAGRKQYRYHDRWRERRDQEKFESMVRFARALPKLRERVAGPRSRGHAQGQGAGLRGAPDGPRLLSDRLRGLRRGERHLRHRHHGQAARDGVRRRDHLRLRGQGPPAACPGDR